MPSPDQLHTLSVRYDDKHSLTCISVEDFVNYRLVDFREFLPVEIAEEELKTCAVGVTNAILKIRETSFGSSREVPNIEKVGAFLGGIAVQPFGRLSYVNKLTLFDKAVTSPGVTSNLHRQSFIIDSNIHMDNRLSGHRSAGNVLTKDEFLESTAVHELIHLAGIPDILYFIADQRLRRTIRNTVSSPCALKQIGKEKCGSFFEEGFATLGAYMYLWRRHPELVQDPRTEPRRAPTGFEMDIPVRHALYSNSYAYAAWAMERLVDLTPKVWSIFKQSRIYGTDPQGVRELLKQEVDKLRTGLFDALDSVNLNDLTQTMRASEVVNICVNQALGEYRS